ncbi:MAG TPA: hypothetical protein VF407_05025, partial [Polyangiaceae bacterium]
MAVEGKKKLRLVLLVLVVVALFTTGFVLQRRGELHPHDLAEKIRAFGAWALPVFFGLCIVAELLHVPGMLFVVVAQLVFGRYL